MKIILEATEKEIVDLVLALQKPTENVSKEKISCYLKQAIDDIFQEV